MNAGKQQSLFAPEVRRRIEEERLRAQETNLPWPPPERMPLNLGERTVADTVLADLRASHKPMIVTGYSSLAFLIAHLPDFAAAKDGEIRLLIGNEPADRPNLEIVQPVPERMRAFWMRHGLSVRQAPKLVRLMEMLREGRLRVRTLDDLHAKLYLGNHAATLGSSNFSEAGFRQMREANVRFSARDAARRRELRQVAENLWTLAKPFEEGLLALLEELLRVASFEEAVARACAALLDGRWAEAWLHELEAGGEVRLWPSQREGIARALWILEQQGSVLIADATGAGKTRMGCHLLAALQRRLVRRGRAHGGLFVLVAPPGVIPHWARERARVGLNIQIHSDGVLSNPHAAHHEQALQDVRRAQCLAVDEAHHFLNRNAQRTRRMLGSLADHVVLFTATPINRGVRDILALVDLLGADNLDDEALDFFDELEQRLRRLGSAFALTPEERRRLQRLLGRFVLRRTKRDLKAAIDADPDAYRDDAGRPCRYPEHESHVYALNEPPEDRRLAEEIRALAFRLKGLIQFQREIRKPHRYPGSDADYVRHRLHVAQALAMYRIMAALRSSRAALVEHLRGTAEACRRFGIAPFKAEDTGNEIGRLKALAGQVPSCAFADALPEWLREEKAHRRAVEEEIAILQEIEARVMQMTDARERARLELLLRLREEGHTHLLAFDSRLISLAWMRDRLRKAAPDAEVLLATGDAESDRRRLERHFAPGAEAAGRAAIALCSDAVSEGVNLQQASALVLLDLPSVIRIAEQRIGRIDRLNSPHARVHIYWPKDAPEFALARDRNFVRRHLDVGALLGANIEVPDEIMGELLAEEEEVPDSAQAMMEAVERGEVARWDGLVDALEPVRRLVEGEDAIVSPKVWRDMRRIQGEERLFAVVEAARPWAFFAVAGVRPEGEGQGGAPQWIWLEGENAAPITDIEEIARRLRAAWQEGVRELARDAWPRDLEARLAAAAARLDRAEEQLLPRRRRRALMQMREVLAAWQARSGSIGRLSARILAIISAAQSSEEATLDWHALADAWLEATMDVRLEVMREWRRTRPLRLDDLTPLLIHHPIPEARLRFLEEAASKTVPRASRRALVCVLAVPHQE